SNLRTRQRRLNGDLETVTDRRQEYCDHVAAVVTGGQANSRRQSILPASPVVTMPCWRCSGSCGRSGSVMFSAVPLAQRYPIVTRTGPRRTEYGGDCRGTTTAWEAGETVPQRLSLPLSPCSAAPAACRHTVRLEALTHAPLFASLPADELIALEGRVSAPGYIAGERIYRAGDRAGSLFVVASGAVKLLRPSPRGDNAVVSVLGPGDSFGTLTRIEHCAET